jgi:hypothetical protein
LMITSQVSNHSKPLIGTTFFLNNDYHTASPPIRRIENQCAL